ncbi:MAG: DUF2970 domain-containing protein [Methylococcaceae bacterium]|jgi:hypothetical protein|nr:DUF2970 domain-containing protein [Methylococcaceae bacterium]
MSNNPKPSFFQVISSVVSAAFGVQSSANRERDFTGGSAKTYIVAGIVFTVIFILAIVGVVRLVLA